MLFASGVLEYLANSQKSFWGIFPISLVTSSPNDPSVSLVAATIVPEISLDLDSVFARNPASDGKPLALYVQDRTSTLHYEPFAIYCNEVCLLVLVGFSSYGTPRTLTQLQSHFKRRH
ncbi:hypothetical protein BDD12DRAFT_857778 [Trichophaea hybrida]|nr:hypothetical protein BDD12DRAFT_857778 [Trichophaea hybrida]